MTGDFKFSVVDCDVEDKKTLQKYREKRAAWLNWLEQDESHAILPLIHNMAWNDVVFRFLARMAEKDTSSPLRNSLVAEAIVDGHFATQVLAVRRLMDRTKGVISLRRLLSDLKKHRGLLTRENYVSHDGLPYDYEEAERRVWKSREGGGPFWGATTGPDAYSKSKRTHESFDQLAGVVPERRSRTEQIPSALFDRLSKWLDASDADQLVDWSHNFLAHGADVHSRQRIDLAAVQPSLAKITNAIRCLARVSEVVARLFSSGFGELIPIAQFNKYEFLSSAVLSESDCDALERYWDSLIDERNAFLDDVSAVLISPPLTLGLLNASRPRERGEN